MGQLGTKPMVQTFKLELCEPVNFSNIGHTTLNPIRIP